MLRFFYGLSLFIELHRLNTVKKRNLSPKTIWPPLSKSIQESQSNMGDILVRAGFRGCILVYIMIVLWNAVYLALWKYTRSWTSVAPPLFSYGVCPAHARAASHCPGS